MRCFILSTLLVGSTLGYPGMKEVDYAKVRQDIWSLLDAYKGNPDGGLGPVMLRLAWHSAGTWDPEGVPKGGSCGAGMRWAPQKDYYDNVGLKIARDALEVVRDMNPGITYSDLWVLGGYVAVEHMGGPHIGFIPGRKDFDHSTYTPVPDDRLPAWNLTADAMIKTFSRMGMSQREMVALLGGHSVGHTQPQNSGFPFLGWDITPLKFDNFFYRFIFDQTWTREEEGNCGGTTCVYFRNRSWIMLIVDLHLRDDPRLSPIAKEYAENEELWWNDFSSAFRKLTEKGMEVQQGTPGCPHAARK
eukprot:TRINITY_DN15730_c0_g1_i1.p1 TRINITY_DN15730_c0_g1~~TRINITY_DN15730_c0_g1_i1.p1  ORF type:complete len:314 (+),score=38.85 TRINITY_DN15730_c0_g1_i1:38-943(+)